MHLYLYLYCISIFIYPSIYCIYLCIYQSIYIYVYANVYIYIIYTHTYIHACMHACMHTYLHTYTRTYVHTYSIQRLLLNLHVSLLIRFFFAKKTLPQFHFAHFTCSTAWDVCGGNQQEILTAMDDPFYMAAFRSKKLKRRNRRILQKLRAHKLIGTSWGEEM